MSYGLRTQMVTVRCRNCAYTTHSSGSGRLSGSQSLSSPSQISAKAPFAPIAITGGGYIVGQRHQVGYAWRVDIETDDVAAEPIVTWAETGVRRDRQGTADAGRRADASRISSGRHRDARRQALPAPRQVQRRSHHPHRRRRGGEVRRSATVAPMTHVWAGVGVAALGRHGRTWSDEVAGRRCRDGKCMRASRIRRRRGRIEVGSDLDLREARHRGMGAVRPGRIGRAPICRPGDQRACRCHECRQDRRDATRDGRDRTMPAIEPSPPRRLQPPTTAAAIAYNS